VTVVSPTEITATAPAEYKTTPSKKVYVTVKTTAGTSPAAVDFEYVAGYPTVESVSPSTVTTKVSITGTGFVSTVGDTVSFVLAKSTGAPTTTSSNTKSSSSVTVETATTITASVPTLTCEGTYFVTVTVPGVGTSSYYPKFKNVDSTCSSSSTSGTHSHTHGGRTGYTHYGGY